MDVGVWDIMVVVRCEMELYDIKGMFFKGCMELI